MLFFTHLFLANSVLKFKEPSGDYLVGAVLPDIRYVNSISRDMTHKSPEDFSSKYPFNNPLFSGYLVHLYVDYYTNISDIYGKAKKTVPWFLKRFMNKTLVNILLELHYLNKYQVSKDKYNIVSHYDTRLTELGIKETEFNEFVLIISNLVNDPNLSKLFEIIQMNPRLKNNPKIQRYYSLGSSLIRIKWLTAYMLRYLEPMIIDFETGFSCYVKEHAVIKQ